MTRKEVYDYIVKLRLDAFLGLNETGYTLETEPYKDNGRLKLTKYTRISDTKAISEVIIDELYNEEKEEQIMDLYPNVWRETVCSPIIPIKHSYIDVFETMNKEPFKWWIDEEKYI